MKIRRAKKKDASAIVDLAMDFWKQTDYGKAGVEADYQYSVDLVCNLMDHGVVQVAEKDGQLIGYIAMLITGFMFNPKTSHAVSVSIYVVPEHRSTGAGIKLIKQAENVCKQLGAELITFSSGEYEDVERTNKVLERLGYKKAETAFTKGI